MTAVGAPAGLVRSTRAAKGAIAICHGPFDGTCDFMDESDAASRLGTRHAIEFPGHQVSVYQTRVMALTYQPPTPSTAASDVRGPAPRPLSPPAGAPGKPGHAPSRRRNARDVRAIGIAVLTGVIAALVLCGWLLWEVNR